MPDDTTGTSGTPSQFPLQGPGQLPVASLELQKAYLRDSLTDIYNTYQTAQQEIRTNALASLGPPRAAAVMAANDLRSQIQPIMGGAQDAVTAASTQLKAQALDTIGGALTTAQTVFPNFPDAHQLATELNPAMAMVASMPVSCSAFQNVPYETAVATYGPVGRTHWLDTSPESSLGFRVLIGPPDADGRYTVQVQFTGATRPYADYSCVGGPLMVSRGPGYMPGSGPPPAEPPQFQILPAYGSGPAPTAPIGSAGLLPGSGPGPATGAPAGGVVPGSGAPPSMPFPGSGVLPGSGAPPSGGAPVGGQFPPPGTTQLGPTTCTNFTGAVWEIPAGQVCGSGPPPGYTLPPAAPPYPYSPPVYQQPPTVPSTPPTTPPRPETPTKPLPPPVKDCIKICKDEPCPDVPDNGVCVYQTSNGLCYVVDSNSPPRDPSDTKLTCAGDRGIALSTLLELCRKPSQQPTPQTPGAPFVPGGVGIPGCETFIGAPALEFPAFAPFLSVALGLRDEASNLKTWGDCSTGNPISDAICTQISGIVRTFTDQISVYVKSFLDGAGCGSPEYIGLSLTRAIDGILSLFIGNATEGVGLKAQQNARYLCPAMLPSPDNAIECYLANAIDAGTAECWTRAGNQIWADWTKLIESRQSKLDEAALVAYWRRGKINEAQLNDELRRRGWLNANYAQAIKDLSEQIPPASDLVTFMVRDVEDQNIVQRFGLDTDFNQKYAGKIPDWAKAQGVSDDYMLRVWRSHWGVPAPTNCYEFWHKLRHDPQFGGPQQLQDDITTALEQQDILPFWIPYYLASSYHPPTRVDTRRMFEAGTINRDEVWLAFTQQGYSDQNAEKLTQFAESQKLLKLQNDKYVRGFVKGVVSETELTRWLTSRNATDDEVNEIIRIAKNDRIIARRMVCHKAWRKRYLLGEYSADQVKALIIDDGLDVGTAEVLVDGWTCEKSSKGKHVPAAQLCRWFMEGIISTTDYYGRLLNLGYGQDDADGLVSDCEYRLQVKRTAEQQKQIKQLLQQAKSDEAAREKAQRQAAAAARQREAALEKARKATNRRRNLIAEIAFQLLKTAPDDTGATMDFVENIARTITAATGGDYDSVLEIGVKASKDADAKTPDGLAGVWSAAVTSAVQNPETTETGSANQVR